MRGRQICRLARSLASVALKNRTRDGRDERGIAQRRGALMTAFPKILRSLPAAVIIDRNRSPPFISVYRWWTKSTVYENHIARKTKRKQKRIPLTPSVPASRAISTRLTEKAACARAVLPANRLRRPPTSVIPRGSRSGKALKYPDALASLSETGRWRRELNRR